MNHIRLSYGELYSLYEAILQPTTGWRFEVHIYQYWHSIPGWHKLDCAVDYTADYAANYTGYKGKGYVYV